MINDSVITALSHFRLRHIFPVLLIIVVSSSCSLRSTTIQTEIVVHNAENIVLPEPDITDEEPDIVAEYPDPVEVSNPAPIESGQPSDVSQPEPINVSRPELAKVSHSEAMKISKPDISPFFEKEREKPENPSAADRRFYARYSKKLGIPLDGTENKALIRSIARWLRVPFKWGGCSKRGVDCSCFVKLVYKDVYGISLNRTSRNIVYKNLDTIKKQELQEGDIISFKIDGDMISHIGIYLKNNKFVHVSRSKGVRISSLNRKYYKERFFSAGRVKARLGKVYVAKKTSKPTRVRHTSRSEKSIKLGQLIVLESTDDDSMTLSSM